MVISFQMWFESLWWCILYPIRSNTHTLAHTDTFVRNSCHVINIKHKNHARRLPAKVGDRMGEKRMKLCIERTLWSKTPCSGMAEWMRVQFRCVFSSSDLYSTKICLAWYLARINVNTLGHRRKCEQIFIFQSWNWSQSQIQSQNQNQNHGSWCMLVSILYTIMYMLRWCIRICLVTAS